MSTPKDRNDQSVKNDKDVNPANDTRDLSVATAPALGTSRRSFFKLAGVASSAVAMAASRDAGAAAAGAPPVPKASLKKWTGGKFPKSPVIAKGRVLGANDRITVGFIGVGGMGFSHVRNFKKNEKDWNTQSVAVADVYQPHAERAKGHILDGAAEGAPAVMVDKDYRKILENKDIDAVVIATPEHWHCQVAVHALEAGKQVYVEKPLSRYLDEAFQVYDVAKRTGKIVQVGAHHTSDPKYAAAREIIASGKLGPLVSAQSSYTRNAGAKGEWNYEIKDAGPHNLDWNMWLGSAPKRPWNEDSLSRFFRYRKYRDYSAGILGDLMPHLIHPLLYTLESNDWPLEVSATGTREVSTDREVADNVTVTAHMQGGWTFFFIGSTVNEQGLQELVRGHKGTMYLAGGQPELKPERPFVEELEPVRLEVKDPGPSHVKHERNWIESIRANKQPICNLELAIRTQALVSLAEIAEVSKRTVAFDHNKRTWKYV
jgi:predicted dehydrogenase